MDEKRLAWEVSGKEGIGGMSPVPRTCAFPSNISLPRRGVVPLALGEGKDVRGLRLQTWAVDVVQRAGKSLGSEGWQAKLCQDICKTSPPPTRIGSRVTAALSRMRSREQGCARPNYSYISRVLISEGSVCCTMIHTHLMWHNCHDVWTLSFKGMMAQDGLHKGLMKCMSRS